MGTTTTIPRLDEDPQVIEAAEQVQTLRERAYRLEAELKASIVGRTAPTPEQLVAGDYEAPRQPSEIQAELQAVKVVLQTAGHAAQEAVIAAEKRRVAAEAPDYRRAVKAIAQAVEAVLEASAKERAIRTRLEEAGVRMRGPRGNELAPFDERPLRAWIERARKLKLL